MGRFGELLAHDGVEEDLELRSRFGFMAFHGGSLEEGTDAVASAAAEAAGASLYAVRQPESLQWHIPSIEFDPAESTSMAAFLAHVDVAVTIHGFGRDTFWTTLLLGGGNRSLAGHLAEHLRAGLDGYTVVDDLSGIPRDLRGIHPRNPVNVCRDGGVQIELPPRVRMHGPHWKHLPPDAPIPDTADLIAALAEAALTWEERATG